MSKWHTHVRDMYIERDGLRYRVVAETRYWTGFNSFENALFFAQVSQDTGVADATNGVLAKNNPVKEVEGSPE